MLCPHVTVVYFCIDSIFVIVIRSVFFKSRHVLASSVGLWSLWHHDTALATLEGSLQMRHGQQALCPHVAGRGASVSNILAIKRWPWLVASVPGRAWQIGQSLPLFKIWCRGMQVEQPWYQVHSTTRTVDLTSIQESWTLVLNEVWCGELLGAKRLKSEVTFKGSGHVQFEWLQ